MRLNSVASGLGVALWIGGASLAAHGEPPPGALTAPLSPDADAATFRRVCGRCHDTALVADTPRSYDDWEDTVQKMIDLGAEGSDDQFVSVMTYLYKTLTTINVNTAGVEDLAAVLHASPQVADAIVARRASRKFTDLSDLKTVPGLDPALLDAKAKLIFY